MNKKRKRLISLLLLVLIVVIFKNRIIRTYDLANVLIKDINFKMLEYKKNMQKKAKDFKNRAISVYNIDNYKEEKSKLIKQIEEKEFKLQNLEKLKKENEILRQNLDLKEKSKLETIAAEVILSDNFGESILYIDKGYNSGIKLGQVVMYFGNMIGRITDIKENSAQVTLLTDDSSKLSVILDDNYLAVLRGNGNGTFSINNYNLDIDIDKNEVFNIKTSGISDSILKDINVGTYIVTDKQHFKNTKELIFKPTYNYANIRLVLVVKEVKQ